MGGSRVVAVVTYPRAYSRPVCAESKPRLEEHRVLNLGSAAAAAELRLLPSLKEGKYLHVPLVRSTCQKRLDSLHAK